MERKFVLSENQLLELLICRDRLDCLMSDGVDNWEWYMESKRRYLEDGFESYFASLPEDCDWEDLARLELEDYQIL